MSSALTGIVAIVTGASSGIGHATARSLSEQGASVALVARRQDRLDDLVTEIENAGGTAFAVATDISDRAQAEAAIQKTVDHFGRLDILVNNAGLMILGTFKDADVDDFEKMIAINQKGLLYLTKAALPHLQKAAEDDVRGVADIVNISSIAGRQASATFGVYSMTKFGVNGFSESLRQEITQTHVRVGVLEPGAVNTELVSHNTDEVQKGDAEFMAGKERLVPEDIADGVTYMVTRPRHMSIGEIWIMPTEQI